ncbi:cytochrome c3 family protein [Desulfovibrio sp. Fe33]|uniref:cytochrome c3 family protein n=1 Tax=Desulfovibrio sp. Fe33 TaxID=3020842 RepID=UPI00234D086D|nr:cytochrome c3 family protein [Desulfovibrio sp. Fe33]
MRRIVITLMALFTFGLAVSAWAAPSAPGDIKLGPPTGMEATKSLVDFPHGRHVKADMECATCHHTWDGKSEIKGCSASGCHDQPGKKEATAFYSAFHAKNTDKSCLGCHKIVKKRDGKPVPISCKQCHAD